MVELVPVYHAGLPPEWHCEWCGNLFAVREVERNVWQIHIEQTLWLNVGPSKIEAGCRFCGRRNERRLDMVA